MYRNTPPIKCISAFVQVIQVNSEKCTGAFKFWCRVIFYSSESCRKCGLISYLSTEFTQKNQYHFECK